MTVTILPDTRKGMALLRAKLGVQIFEFAREMPGRRRWQGRDLLFEMTRANVVYINEKFPDAVWEVDRLQQVQDLEQLEADARAAKLADLPPEASNFAYKTVPREHQRRAFLVSRDRDFYGYFLEQGLGKTKIDFDDTAYAWASGKIDTFIIDAPNGVHAQWIDEQMPLHLPDWVPRRALVYTSTQTKRWLREAEEWFAYHDGLRILAIHHDAFTTDKGLAFMRRVLSSGKCKWSIDESSRKIKTPGAKRTKETLKLRDMAVRRRLLDGTPVTKGVEDLFTQLKFLSNDVHGFSSFYTFRNRYCKVAQVPGAPTGVVKIIGYQNLEELQKRMDGWTIRLRSADCLDLPERIYSQHYVAMTDEQKRLYTDLKEELVAQLDSGELITAEQAVVKLLRLQQILCGHVKTENGVIRSVSTNRPAEALAVARQTGDKVIVWARFHHDIDLLSATFKEDGWSPVTWDGRTSIEERAAAKRRFIEDPSCGAFIANPGSAGTGTDGLQHASHSMIYYSNTFKASERWQSEARLFRDGQKGTVNVTDLVVPNTCDVHILRTLKSRRDIAVTALDIRNFI